MILQNNHDLDYLLSKYIDKNCTQEEIRRLYEIVTLQDNEKTVKEILLCQLNKINEDQYENYTVDIDKIYARILAGINQNAAKVSTQDLIRNRSRIRRLITEVVSFAAVFCIAFLLGRIHINKNENAAGLPSSIAYNEIKAPMGAKSEVYLSDGTQIMLNAGSTIKYKTDYNTLNRDLLLEGEAYFKVARNADLPLIVNAGKLTIKATGTEFNVKAYSEEGIIETTLIEGEVEIAQAGKNAKDDILQLKPNQKAIYANKSDQIFLRKIKEIEPLAFKPDKTITINLLVSTNTDIDQVTAWTKNKLIIKRENLESLCIKLQRKYNVTFHFGDEEIKKYRFTGVLLDETFEQVMDAIKLVAPIKYSMEGKVITLGSDRNRIDQSSGLNKN